MNFRQHRLSLAAALVGAVVLAAHVTLGVVAVLTLSQWMSGAAIGLVVLGLAVAHLVAGRHSLPGHQRNSPDERKV